MDWRDSFCPYVLSSETTAKGTGFAQLAGKEDPVELDSTSSLEIDLKGVAYPVDMLVYVFFLNAMLCRSLKHRDFLCWFSYLAEVVSLCS